MSASVVWRLSNFKHRGCKTEPPILWATYFKVFRMAILSKDKVKAWLWSSNFRLVSEWNNKKITALDTRWAWWSKNQLLASRKAAESGTRPCSFIRTIPGHPLSEEFHRDSWGFRPFVYSNAKKKLQTRWSSVQLRHNVLKQYVCKDDKANSVHRANCLWLG